MNKKSFFSTHTITVGSIISFTWRDLLFNFLHQFAQEITGGKGVDVAVEALGKPQTFAQCTQSVKDGGKAVMIGLAQAGSVGEMDINRLVRRKVRTLIYVGLLLLLTYYLYSLITTSSIQFEFKLIICALMLVLSVIYYSHT